MKFGPSNLMTHPKNRLILHSTREKSKRTRKVNIHKDYDDLEEKKKKSIKKPKNSSNLSDSKSFDSFNERLMNFREESQNHDVIMNGLLHYRYNLDQIELEGNWSMNNDMSRERFSYLFLRKNDKLSCSIKKEEIEFNSKNEETSLSGKDEFVVNVCSANLFEIIPIQHPSVFKVLLQYISGEYHGFFMYYEKTIEDRFVINFSLEDSQVRITGEGTNNLGNFNLIGYLNFFRSKDDILMKNDVESEVVVLGEFKMSKIYNAFNPNENFRVIKSFQHRKKKISSGELSN